MERISWQKIAKSGEEIGDLPGIAVEKVRGLDGGVGVDGGC